MNPHPIRHRVDQTLLSSLPRRLTDRDRLILQLLYDHRVLTSTQILDIGFDAPRRCTRRMLRLYQCRLVDRFRPMVKLGSAPHHWILDRAGAHVIAAERGINVKDVGWDHDQITTLARNERLRHIVGVNGFFAALLRAARRDPALSLETWWSERECDRRWGRLVRPDGYGVWKEAAATLPFLVEYDRGTEALSRLGAKLDGYARLQAATGHPTAVLFAFESRQREAGASRVLDRAEIPVATAVVGPGTDPSAAIWRVPGGTATVRLIDLVGCVLAKHRAAGVACG